MARETWKSLLHWVSPSEPKLHEQTVDYSDGGETLTGYLIYDESVSSKRPGVVVYPEWWGLNTYARTRAAQLARLGYIAFAADIYGGGKQARNREEAGKFATRFRQDRPLMRRRAAAALDWLRDFRLAEPARLAAIGYCFGGTCVLELARSGGQFRAGVVFHGGLDAPAPAEPGAIQPEMLILHGAEDPLAPMEQVTAFADEMRRAGALWQLMLFSGAVHAFTNPDAGNDPSTGVAFNERAANRSWSEMKLFFLETIGLPLPGGEVR